MAVITKAIIVCLLTILATGISTSPCWANTAVNRAAKFYAKNPSRSAQVALQLYRAKLYFSSVAFIKRHLALKRPLTKELEKLILNLTFKAGLPAFKGLGKGVYRSYPDSPSLSFILGLKLFQMGDYKRSLKVLKRIPPSHILATESFFVLGSINTILGRFREAHAYYEKCHHSSKYVIENTKSKRLGAYLTVIGESCTTHRARLLYQQEKYQEALNTYNDIPKTSYMWPYLLLEKAWVHYQQKNYNQALGSLVTYKSPLLTSYFLPETDVLRALSYFRLCLWDESSQIIKEYYAIQLGRSRPLKRMLLRHKKSKSYFLKLMLLPVDQQRKLNPFIRNLTTQIGKKTKFALELATLKRAQKEYQYIRKLPRNRLTGRLRSSLSKILQWHTVGLNHYVKTQMFDFLNSMHRFSYEISNIELKIISDKRAQLSKSRGIPKNEQADHNPLKYLNRTSIQYFYTFDGEFWADELGDYSFGLGSQCLKTRSEDV